MSEMTEEEKDEATIKVFEQIKYRLETFPFSNHECIALRDALIGIMRALSGENLDNVQLAPGPGAAPSEYGDAITTPDGMVHRGGQEIAPGVMVYGGRSDGTPVQHQQHSLIDVQASMPKALPGSLMAQALGEAPPGIPDASETKLEIVLPDGEDG